MKGFLTFIIILIALGGVAWYMGWIDAVLPPKETTERSDVNLPDVDDNTDTQNGTTTESQTDDDGRTVIGQSANGNDIYAHRFGSGDDELLFVGGIHGGYSWNTALVAYELIDYLTDDPSVIPENVTVSVIPVLNPDGLARVTGTTTRFAQADVSGDTVPGRFNGNDVDLNRNFNCNWQDTATWRDNPVDPGESAFSEPESKALRDYVQNNDPVAAIVWYSAAGGVFTSACNSDVMTETDTLMDTFADGSGYPAEGYFDAYTITGDAVDWMAKQGIPAVSVILETHNQVEWSKNKAGIEATLEYYSDQ